MKAYVYHGREDLRLEDVPTPEPGAGEVQVRIAYNGICGTDIHEFYDGPMFLPVEPHPRTGWKIPMITGHEASGEIAALGAGVTGLAVGDRVAIEPTIHRGPDGPKDPAYNRGWDGAYYGSMAPGTFAEFAVVNDTSIHRLPDGVSLAEGALVEPMAVGYHAAMRTGLSAGQTGVVFGAGPIGTGVFFALRSLDLEKIFVVEPSASRRAVIERHGAIAIDPAAGDVAAAIKEQTDGRGADGAVDAAGVQASFDAALAGTAAGATVVIVAVFAQPLEFNPNLIILEEKTVTTSIAYAHDFPPVLDLMQRGGYPTDGWVDRIGFDQVLTDGFPVLRRGEATKLLVEIAGG